MIELPGAITLPQAWVSQYEPLRLTSMTWRKLLGGLTKGRVRRSDPRVVDQHVDATELPDYVVDGALALRGVDDVGLVGTYSIPIWFGGDFG